MDAWKHQRELQKLRPPKMDKMIRIASSIKDYRNRALFSMCYLTAGRISEVVEITKKDIRRDSIKGLEVMVVSMPNRKHKTRRFKEIPINVEKDHEMVRFLDEYLVKLKPEDKLFPFTIQRAWQILKETGFNPHFIRHIRLTHLVTYYNFTDQRLVSFAGWTTSAPAKYYMELRLEDLVY